MDMDDDGVTDPTAAFGELFEGQTVAFESELGGHADDVLGAIGHSLSLGGSHHRQTHHHHPSDHEILSANLSFVPDDYLQHSHIVIDNENGEFVGNVGGLEREGQNPTEGQQIYIQPQTNQGQRVQMNIGNASISYEYQGHLNQAVTGAAGAPNPTTFQNGPKVKRKVKVVKNVEYFTNENMERYLKRRGFKMKGVDEPPTKSISKTVLALSVDSELSFDNSNLVKHGTKFEPEHIVPEIERFWKFYLWTKTKSQLMSEELLPILIPMLLHFYFQMMLTNLLQIARRVCLEFSKKFINEDKTQENYDILVSVMKVNSVEMLKTDSNLRSLINKKYEFTLSEITFTQLRRFLSKSTQPVLINLFTDFFKIRSRESKEFFESLDWDLETLNSDSSESEEVEVEEETIEDVKEDEKSDPNDESAAEEKKYTLEVIGKLRNSVTANLPAISVYTSGDDPICGAVSKKGTVMAFGLAEAGVRIFSVDNARDVIKVYQQNSKFESDPCNVRTIAGHAGTVYGVNFHPRTKLLFTVGEDSFMRTWDLNCENPRCRAVYKGHTGPIWNLDIPESGSLVATAGLDSTARIFLPEKTEFVRIMVGHYFSVNVVKFHPNEAYIATGSADKSVRLWSVNDGTMVRMFTGAVGTISALAFHKSGKYLAGAGEGNKIIIWDLSEGEAIATLDCLSNCKDLEFSGSILSACFRNGMLQIFNLRPILGGCSSNTFEELDRAPSISSPWTTKCFANTLFRCHFKDPGMLFCLGSDLVESEEERRAKENVAKVRSMTDNYACHEEPARIRHTFVGSKGSINSPKESIEEPEAIPSAPPSVSACAVNSGETSSGLISGGSSRILAARLSQPLSSVGDESEAPMSIETPTPLSVGATGIPTPLTGEHMLMHRSPLDAAFSSSVLDHDVENVPSVPGTITMYASN